MSDLAPYLLFSGVNLLTNSFRAPQILYFLIFVITENYESGLENIHFEIYIFVRPYSRTQNPQFLSTESANARVSLANKLESVLDISQ
jgi:hypothetical protein